MPISMPEMRLPGPCRSCARPYMLLAAQSSAYGRRSLSHCSLAASRSSPTPTREWRSSGLCHGLWHQPVSIRPFAAAAASEVHQSQAELPKAFDAAETQERLYKWWEESGYFRPDETSSQEPFVMSMPPPNVTGKLHMGHAMFVTLQDCMTRYQRMRGRPTLWLPGTDHAGIATQMVVEKSLAAEGTSRQEIGREAFTQRVWDWRRLYGDSITNQLRCLGASCDWSRERFTLDDGLSAGVNEAFVRLHQQGLVYRSAFLVNWSPSLRTAISDLEVEYRDEPGKLYHFKYPLAGDSSGVHLPVATTRPETILGDTAVAVHPQDPRYKHLIGKECEVPLCDGRRIPIIASEKVERDFGSGALKITPGHDPTDFEIGQAAGLPSINLLHDDGALNANGGKYEGMYRDEARKAIWADLEAAGLGIKVQDHQMRVPRSQRGGDIVEPLVRDQWFVKAKPLAEPALQAVADGRIKIMPDRFRTTYNRWLGGIRDWCISRQLWWGHRIPVWYLFPDQEAAEASPDGRSGDFVVARDEEAALQLAQERAGEGVVLRQEADVLDTWFSSGLWPFSTLGWPDSSAPDLQRYFPTSAMETGHDILFFWVARMVMLSLNLTGQVPFDTVYLHGLVRDDKGRKMSKSLGNVVDPLNVIEEYSCDALRFTLATGTAPGQDLNLSTDRIKATHGFVNKVWNAGKFVLMACEAADEAAKADLARADFSSPEAAAQLPLAERWILGALHQVVDECTAAHEKLDFLQAGRVAYDFFWNQFADWYVEASKTRLYGQDPDRAATSRQVLVYCFRTMMALLHPLMPFVTERLWQALPHEGPALIAAAWPATQAHSDARALRQFEALQTTVRSIRNARAEYGVELGRRIPATILVADDALREALQGEADVLASLAKLDLQQLDFQAGEAAQQPHEATSNGANSSQAPSGETIVLVVAEGLQVSLPLAGLFDPQKEADRLTKQRDKLAGEIQGMDARLSNQKFVSKAPEKVVNEVKTQREEAAQRLKLLEEKLQQMLALM